MCLPKDFILWMSCFFVEGIFGFTLVCTLIFEFLRCLIHLRTAIHFFLISSDSLCLYSRGKLFYLSRYLGSFAWVLFCYICVLNWIYIKMETCVLFKCVFLLFSMKRALLEYYSIMVCCLTNYNKWSSDSLKNFFVALSDLYLSSPELQ